MSGLLPHRRKAFRQVAPANFDGFGNKSRSFNGVDDHVDLNSTNPLNGKNQLTFSAWIKMDVVDFGFVAGSLASNSVSRFRVMIRDTGLIHVIWGDGSSYLVSTQDGAALQDGEWAHIAVTFNNSGNMTRYFNGIQTGTIDDLSSYGSLSVTEDIFIGARNRGTTATDLYFNGNIADVRIYDTDLSSTDIADLYTGTNITTNLVGHWLKDTDDVLDHSVNSNNGENFGSIFSPDNPSPAVEFGRASRFFNGNTVQYVSVPDSATLPTGAQTYSLWTKPRSTRSGGSDILGQWGDSGNLSFLLYYIGSDLRVYLSGSGSSPVNTGAYSLSPATGTWHHVAFVFVPSTSLTLYVNGTQVRQVTTGIPASRYDSTADFRFGKMDRSYNAPFDGNIADVRMYDTDLSSTDISDLYNGTDVQTNLIGHWLTDNDDVEDKAGTNDGTNFGSTYSYDAPLPANKLIDTYASACGAYSLRELTTAWAGQNVIDVRRVSDGSINSFTSTEITDGTLASFCGTSGGFVSKVYDQSGNGFDLIQPKEADQPRIYTGATQTISTSNGLPCLDFSLGAYLYNANSFDYEGGVSWYSVIKVNTASQTGRVWCDDIIGVQGYVNFYYVEYNLNDGGGYEAFNTTGQTTNQQLRSFNFDESQGSYNYGFNGSSTSGSFGTWAGSIETSGSSNIGVMGAGNGTQTLQGLWQELIIYPNDQLHNKENIERNINEFYSIY